MKILTILGTRPQFIKAGAFSNYVQKLGLEEVIADSGQHYDASMSSNFFTELGIQKPKYNFMVGGLSHGKMTAEIIKKSEEIILIEKPDFVIVYGDTNTTLGASIASAKLTTPIVHIESGLRSFNTHQPEEINRVLTDKLSTFLFTPSDLAVENLKHEGMIDGLNGIVVKNVGDIMMESMLNFQNSLQISEEVQNLASKTFAILTIHRQENVDNKANIENIFNAIQNFKEEVILPIHPRTAKRIAEFELKIPSNVIVINPVSYGDMIFLVKKSQFVITDSGGLQKEAYFLGKKTIILREETEWKELVENKISLLAGTKTENILICYKEIQNLKNNFVKNIYGDGKTSEKIIQTLIMKLKQ